MALPLSCIPPDRLLARGAVLLALGLAACTPGSGDSSLGLAPEVEPGLDGQLPSDSSAPDVGAVLGDKSADPAFGLDAAQRETLDREGIAPLRVSDHPDLDRPGAFVKVHGLDSDGQLVDVAVDIAGTFYEASDGQALAASGIFVSDDPLDKLDPLSRRTLGQLPLQVGSALDVLLFPRVVLPAEVDPEGLTELSADEGARLFEQRRADLEEARSAARDRMASALLLEVEPVAYEGRGLHVRVAAEQLEELLATEVVQHAQLHSSLLPAPVSGTASANVAMGLDTLRFGPGSWDGNGNGSQEHLGVYEGAGTALVPRLPPFSSTFTFQRSAAACSVHTDCGTCGNSPGNNRSGCQCVSGACVANHLTSVASSLSAWDRSSGSWMRVGMQGADVHVANASSFASGVSWLAANDVHAMSLSQYGGSISAVLRDEAVRDDDIALANLATNGGAAATTCASPNVICIGNYDHSNDTLNNSSASANFLGTDREQPDLVSPGTSLSIFQGNGSWGVGSGTSLSAPIAATAITGLYDMSKDNMAGNNYYPWLENYPEATKALLMAASTNNIQDGPVSNDPAVDERDGAGALDVAELEDIWNSGRWSIRLLDSGDAMNVRWRWVWLDAGDDLRAYMAWSRCPSNTISDLHADFDLRLRGPDGSWVAFGDSFDQTYEGVQYTAQSSGWHSIHSIRWFQGSCGGSQADIVGLAYQRL